MADGKSEFSGASSGARGEASLGKLLTEARKNGGFTAEQVAAETHIPPHYVKAIETDDYGMISDQLYLLPFLRRYATFIGLDPEDVASRFVREVQRAESNTGKVSEPIPMITNERKPGSGGRYGFAIVVLLVLAGIAALVAWKGQGLMQHLLHLSKRTPFSTEPAASPSPAAQESAAAATNATTAAPAKASAAEPANNGATAQNGDGSVAPRNPSSAARASVSAKSAPVVNRITSAPAPGSSPAMEQETPPQEDDSHSIE